MAARIFTQQVRRMCQSAGKTMEAEMLAEEKHAAGEILSDLSGKYLVNLVAL